MCGITGLFRPDDRAPIPDDEADALGRMNDAITHRGPDEAGFWTGPGVGLAMRRLSIIDVRGSHQPQFGPSGQTTVVFNGEIYNYRALRDELIARGHHLQTDGDTEVLPHGYEAWGIEGLLSRLVGMFAFALHDARTGELFLVRDRLGIKPLYVGEFDGTWLFGSELKALLRHPSARREVDAGSLARYLALEYLPAPRSIYRGIGKLRPGELLRLGPGGPVRRLYWRLRWTRDRSDWPHHDIPLPTDDRPSSWRVATMHAVREAVRARLVSEVPIGALLSGGVDSSTTSALMAELVPDLRTFSIGFDEGSFDESAHARAVAAHIGSHHTARTFGADRFGPTLDGVRAWLDEPFADASILPTAFLSQTVKEAGVTVVLSGDGADELFAGYPTYLAARAAMLADQVPGSARLLGRLRGLAEALPSSYDNVSPDYKLRRFLAGAARSPVARHATFLGSVLAEDLQALMAPRWHDVDDGAPFAELEAVWEEARQDGASPLEALTALDLQTYLGEDILTKVDRASMATALEVRVPFLDHRVVELAARMPWDLKLRGTTGKWILKTAASSRLPAGITDRPKKGFGLPVAHWLRGPLRELLLDTLGAAATDRWFDRRRVDRLIDDHLSGRRDQRKPLWTLLMFRLWEDGPWGPGG